MLNVFQIAMGIGVFFIAVVTGAIVFGWAEKKFGKGISQDDLDRWG